MESLNLSRVTSPPQSKAIKDLRLQMIRETEAWVNWALANSDRIPRIPRRRVDEGGFSMLLKMPGARAAIGRWWSRTLDLVDHKS